MTLGFNTTGNSQTDYRTTKAISLGKLRNTIASTTRKFKSCNRNSSDLNVTFNCVFNGTNNPIIEEPIFNTYHTINPYLSPEAAFLPDASTNTVLSGPYSPLQIKSAYSINSATPLNGARNTIITIIAAYYNPYLVSDVAKFGTKFGLPPCNLKIYNFSRYFNSGWAVECTLDVQWAYAINPNAQIRVIMAASSSWGDILYAINFANNKNKFSPPIDTDVLSMSFGANDNGGLSSYNSYFTNSNTIYVASSGDSSVVSFPSCCTNILSIGGTSLKLNSSNNSRSSETVWNGSGTGLSKSFSKPSHQPIITSNNTNSRMTPDVCCVADPNTPGFVILNGNLYSVGGTSLSAPIYAGMLSLVQQNKLNKKQSTYTTVLNKSNSIQPILYNSNNKNCFFDVTSGSSNRFTSGNGFDIPSGLGTFVMNNVLNNL
jgi:subtilase family serine protease